MIINPIALYFVGFCTVIGIIAGDIWAGLAVGLGLVLLVSIANNAERK